MSYLIHIIIMINIYTILCSATNLLVGIAGMFSLGQAAFYGMGAYFVAVVLVKFNLNLFQIIPLVILFVGLIGFIIGSIIIRLEGDFFVLSTLGFQLIVYTILYNWYPVTNGSYGISSINLREVISNIKLQDIIGIRIIGCIFSFNLFVLIYKTYKIKIENIPFYNNSKIKYFIIFVKNLLVLLMSIMVIWYLVYIFTNDLFNNLFIYFTLSSILSLSTIMIISKLIHSPYGRVLKAMRDDPISCTSLGKNITFLKISVFTISASMMSIAGLILASYISYIDPTIFNLDESIYILSVLIIGGSGNIKGPIVGAIFMVLFPELLRLIGLPDSIAANLRMISYGVLLILTMNYFPQGIAGEFKFRG